jgi:hypothetical protein
MRGEFYEITFVSMFVRIKLAGGVVLINLLFLY